MRGIRPPRRLMLAGLLLVLIASPGSGERTDAPDAMTVAMVERAPARVDNPDEALTQAAAADIDLSRLQRAKARRSAAKLFAPHSFYTPPPPPPPAPVVVAKGSDHLAFLIRNIAREQGVPVRERARP